ncbi:MULTISPECIES: C1q-like domain-containing protein [Zobellia]|uniref:Conserved hypothetical periplasmic protein n=1 Tax=Zobellia galactanivorans (strain DSM 12802 / CCUG 47099 / CIP 106680 / NCIMB 13871 / Dsij) TaxID=63186 RepID=G0L555_ZOBGA|nr:MULTISPECIES: hypothetical protein [Zobellia]MBU3026542.1 hypothetical protein [Zobellia galactanivorans]OWW26955.1 hypothetical protein B4Q04_04570 [Zobellia sp. OII3]CAZ95962.1 Conserved hypothetical periplasmic protein [Zobellia galactanivorans]
MKRKYYRILTVLSLLFLGTLMVQAQQKNFINYQGVARNSDNELMAQETMEISIALKFGSADAVVQYQESHSVTTDANGVFSLQIGSGNRSTGSFANLPWGEATFVTVSFNGAEAGTTELMAVPYAMASGDKRWTVNGADIENVNTGGVKVKGDLEVLGSLGLRQGNEVDGISDDEGLAENSDRVLPTQKAVKTYVDNRLSGGGGVAQNASEVPYSNAGSGLVSENVQDALDEIASSGGGADADADPTNEIQDISLVGTDLGITGGSTIDLSAIIPPGGTDDQNASEVPFDNAGTGLAASNTQAAIEELASGGLVDTDNQGLVLTGDVLTIEDGTGSVDLGDYVDVTAENGLLTGNGSAIKGLVGTSDGQVAKWDAGSGQWVAGNDEVGAGGGGTLWEEDGSDVYYTGGDVGIGTASPSAQLHVVGATANPVMLETDDVRNWVSYDTSNGYIGYSGVFSGARDMDFGTGSGNSTGKVHLVTKAVPRLTVEANGDVQVRSLQGSGERNVVADANGNLKISEPVVFKYKGSGFAVKDLDGNTVIEADIWENKIYDTTDSFNRTTKRFVCPEEGYYFLHARVDQSNAISSAFFGIKFNIQNNWLDGSTVDGDTVDTEVSGIFKLNAGQEVYVEMRNYSAGLDSRIDGFGSFFEGYRIN